MPGFKELWPGGPVFSYSADAFSLGTDSVLLADFASTVKANNAVELGCGSAAVSLLLLNSAPKLHVTCVEISASAARSASENMAANGLTSRADIINDDLRAYRNFLPAAEFDLVVCNPPYFESDRGTVPKDQERSAARNDTCCRLEDIFECAGWLCKNKAAFCMVMRTERLAETIIGMSKYGIEPKKLRFVSKNAETAPSLFLIEGRKAGRRGLSVLAPLFLYSESGEFSDEYKRIYHLGVAN